ncbi:MAG TPA: hypothetical protein DIW30_08390 [Bacteroidales bacterium]|nr:hypothetical protein [Bacteroidales bacterium]
MPFQQVIVIIVRKIACKDIISFQRFQALGKKIRFFCFKMSDFIRLYRHKKRISPIGTLFEREGRPPLPLQRRGFQFIVDEMQTRKRKRKMSAR